MIIWQGCFEGILSQPFSEGSIYHILHVLLLICTLMVVLQILVAKSPVAPFAMFVYTIEEEGIVLQGRNLIKLYVRNVLQFALPISLAWSIPISEVFLLYCDACDDVHTLKLFHMVCDVATALILYL